MTRAEHWSQVVFTVSVPDTISSPKVFEETDKKQTELDKKHLKALRELFKPYGMTVEKEELP